ncbi:hypothetical protein F610DRAFT_01248 [Streptomyces sp. LaPpAH-199]|nr:hypothetical protein F610DRAFT_01248 [Streptomyces sp. LaPpAH-199]
MMIRDHRTVYRRIVRDLQRHPRQLAVQPMSRKARRNVHHQVGIDGKQPAVEQAVHIRPQHQPLFHAVMLRFGKRTQVSRLQHFRRRRAGHGAHQSVLTHQSATEGVLAAAHGCRCPS